MPGKPGHSAVPLAEFLVSQIVGSLLLFFSFVFLVLITCITEIANILYFSSYPLCHMDGHSYGPNYILKIR